MIRNWQLSFEIICRWALHADFDKKKKGRANSAIGSKISLSLILTGAPRMCRRYKIKSKNFSNSFVAFLKKQDRKLTPKCFLSFGSESLKRKILHSHLVIAITSYACWRPIIINSLRSKKHILIFCLSAPLSFHKGIIIFLNVNSFTIHGLIIPPPLDEHFLTRE